MPTRKTPYRNISTRNTPQTEPIPGTSKNNAGGQSFTIDDWSRLSRFLILGSEGGTYYVSENKLTKDNAKALMRCIAADGETTVRMIVDISVAGRNAKQGPIMLALAACAGATDQKTRDAAMAAIPLVCRTGSHMLMFVSMIEQFRGWGRGLRRAVGEWYTEPRNMPDDAIEDTDMAELSGRVAEAQARFDNWLALQLVKYQQREGWSQRDVLRLAKPRPPRGSITDRTIAWAVGKGDAEGAFHTLLQAHDELHSGVTIQRAAELIELFRVPWEAVPSEMLAKPEIWRALVPNLGIGALVRNLGRMTANGALKPMSTTTAAVMERLTNAEAVSRSRIHPFNVLTAASTYAQGKGVRGSLTWDPDGRISEALDKTFSMAFKNVVPAGKRTLIGLDVSGSMSTPIMGSFLSARVGAAAMSLITYRTEPSSAVMAFSDTLVPVNITPNMGLADLVRNTDRIPFGRTDCSLPMEYAIKQQLDVDTFVILTDSETYVGRRHPVQALADYRKRSGIDAKLIVVGMTATEFSIADPKDKGMLDVVGFDSAAPALIADFSAGRI